MTIAIGKNLILPDNAPMQTFGIVGRKGSGKTYFAGVLVESFLEAKVQVVVLDPVGTWYGLRLDKSGKKPSSFDIPILGGEHGDVPLDPSTGTLIARWLVETGSSAVLDVSGFYKSKRKSFVAEFAEQLYLLKTKNRTPLHLVIEEAQVFAPQRGQGGDERMLGAIEDIVRIGRNRGIGCSMISQRPQSINKEVLNQAEPLVVFQLAAKHERDAIKGWMEHAGENLPKMMTELPQLKTGECYFWSPAWMGTLLKTRSHLKSTFDASATPEVGMQLADTSKLKPVDLDQLRKQLSTAVEKAKGDDPKELRKEITRLTTELQKARSRKSIDPDVAEKFQAIEQENAELLVVVKLLRESIKTHVTDAKNRIDGLMETLEAAELHAESKMIAKNATKKIMASTSAKDIPKPVPSIHAKPVMISENTASNLPKGEGIILTAIAQHHNQGGVDRAQLSILSGYKKSTRDLYVKQLKTKGLITNSGLSLIATEAGFEQLGDFQELPTGPELLQYWLERLPEGEKRVLACLAERSPRSREEIGELCGYQKSTRDLYIKKLKTRKLVDNHTGGPIRISPMLTKTT